MPKELTYHQQSISGRSIRSVRNSLKMTQPQLAQFISRQTGRGIDAKTVARYENYGERDTRKYEKPPKDVESAIVQLARNSPSDGVEANLPESNQGSSIGNNDPSEGSNNQPDDDQSDDDPESKDENVMDKPNIDLVRKVIEQYEKLGLFKAKGQTALEMIESIEASMRAMEDELVGGSGIELRELEKELELLRQEEETVSKDLENVISQLAETDVRP